MQKQKSVETEKGKEWATLKKEPASVPFFKKMVYPRSTHDIQQPINAMSPHPECDKLVVAGKDLLKVFVINEEKKFEEVLNLRHRQQPSWKYTTLDVSWNGIDTTKLVSGTSSGSVIVWELTNSSRIAHAYKEAHTNLIRSV